VRRPAFTPRGVPIVLAALMSASLVALQILPPGARLPVLVGLGGVFLITLMAACIFVLPGWLVARDAQGATVNGRRDEQLFSAKNSVRTTLTPAVVGLAALAGIAVAWQQLQIDRQQVQDQLVLTRQGQVAERFTRAVDQLGEDKLDVQLGGIYALEQIATEFRSSTNPTDRTRLAVFEVLSAYVRQHSPRRDPESLPHGPDRYLLELPTYKPDAQAAMTVLARREASTNDPPLDLHGTNLRGAKLIEAKLEGTKLTDANLVGADLSRAHLQGADFRDANLDEAALLDAKLQGADLTNVTTLQGAQLQGAFADKNTKWPDGFSWQAAGVRMQQ
jgi:hypothetical protein